MSRTVAKKEETPETMINRDNGFTLLELLIVITLITLVLSLSTVFFASTLPSSRFKAAAREVAATMRHARILAQTSGKREVFSLDLDARRYGIEGRGEKDIPTGVEVRVLDAAGEEVSEGTFRLAFTATGGPGGGVIILLHEEREIKIEVDPVIGAVIIRQENGRD